MTDPAPERPPVAVVSMAVAPRIAPSSCPAPFAARIAGRTKRALREFFGLHRLGANLTKLEPGAVSFLRHAHSRHDECVYVLRGHPILRTDSGDTQLAPGMCAGFAAGTGNAHQLVNPTGKTEVYLEVGDRTSGDTVQYPDDDLQAVRDGDRWVFLHKDGEPH